jgi:hypothetical protein
MSIEIAGYTLGEKIHASTTTAIYEAVSQKSGKKFIIKTLGAQYPHRRDIGRLQREYDIVNGLSDIDEVINFHSIEH